MSCLNDNININLKDATIRSLNFISKYTSNTINPNKDRFNYNNDKNDPYSSAFKGEYQNEIQTNLNEDVDNKEGKQYITINTDDNIYVNCAVQTSVPWFTMSKDNKKCEVVKNIEYDEDRVKFEKIKDKVIITPILKSKNENKSGYCVFNSNINKAYCENRWYDWMITPNYYLGNTYYKDTSHYTELDVYKCYKPCEKDFMPYTTESGEIKCIPKKFFGNGIFNRKYMFSSVDLINLIGNLASYNDNSQTNLLYILHHLIYTYNIDNNIDNKIYSKNNDIYNLMTLRNADNNIPTDKSANFNKIKPIYDNIFNELKDTVNNYILKNFDGSKNKDYYNLNEFTYLNYKFNEDEPEMYAYVGMEANELLTPPILIHTWILSQLFKPITEDIIKFPDTKYGASDNDERTNFFKQIQGDFIYNKLLKVFENDKDKKDKAIRLKNIFFKAINNCYNNKTTFSINFISATKKALQNTELIKRITDYNFYRFANNINLLDTATTNNISTITDSMYSSNLTTIIDNINNFKEHKLYKDTEIKTLFDGLNSKTNPKTKSKEFFDEVDIKGVKIPYCHYLYSLEEQESPTCPEGTTFNSQTNECQIVEKKKTEPEDDKLVDDDFSIPELSNILTIFLQIVIVLILLYIFYLIYDIFGEVIISTFNHIIYYMISIYNYIYLYFISGSDNAEAELKKIRYKIKSAEAQAKAIERKDNLIHEYLSKK